MKRQAIDWKKIFAKHISYRGLVSKIYTESLNSTIRKQGHNWKTGKRFRQMCHKRRYMDDKKAHAKMLNITTNRESKLKTMIRYHYTSIRMDKKKILMQYQLLWGYRKTVVFIHCWWEWVYIYYPTQWSCS